MKYKIAYYIVTDLQHIPPVIRLIPHLGGLIITTNKQIYEHIKTKYASLDCPTYLVKNISEAQKIITKNRVRLVIHPGYNVIYRGKSVQIFHGGLSDKNYVESLYILLFNLVLFPGEKTKDKVERSGYLKHIPNWKIIGYPKFDPLVNNNLAYTPVFNNGKKTILYAPTWVSDFKDKDIIRFSQHGESSIHIWAKEIIKSLHKDFNLIIKYHSKLKREPGDIYEQIDELILSIQAESSVAVKIDDNILPYMHEADLMISDISTACYEWFHFNKPIIFANPAPFKYQPSSNISSNTYAWQAGDIINLKEDIKKLVEENLVEDKYYKIRNEIFNYTVFQPDGKATDRQVEAIIEFYKKNEKTPYFLYILSTWAWKRFRRLSIVIVNKYYHLFKKDKVGK